MIISKNHKYLFIETPRTGSTAISSELRKHYGGESILHKHATYMEYKKFASQGENGYFIFAGVRNPLDDAVSRYLKLLHNHKGALTDEKQRYANGGYVTKRILKKYAFVQDKNTDFGRFLQRFYRLPYTSYISVNKRYCDDIIYFENLNDDFFAVLKKLSIEPVRDLPVVNPTENKRAYFRYFTDANIDHAVRIFGPFMAEFGYSFPDGWPARKVSFYDKMLYEFIKKVERLYCRLVFCGPLRRVRFLRELVG